MNKPSHQIDWSVHRNPRPRCPVLVRFQPRDLSPSGRKLKPRLAQHIGHEFPAYAGWWMDEGDPYPGEWAILRAGEEVVDVFPDVLWVASGDVVRVTE